MWTSLRETNKRRAKLPGLPAETRLKLSPALFSQKYKQWPRYAKAIGVVMVFTLLSWLLFPYFAPVNLIMIYLVAVVLISVWWGRGPAILASILSVGVFDFFFVPPYLTFAVSDTQYIVTFGVMLSVGIIISSLTTQIKQQAQVVYEREQRTARLYAMSRDFASNHDIQTIQNIAVQHISDLFKAKVIMFLADSKRELIIAAQSEGGSNMTPEELSVVNWVFQHSQNAGRGTTRSSSAAGLYVPLMTAAGPVGVLGIYPRKPDIMLASDQLLVLETFANQATVAVERARLSRESEQTRVQMETERLRNALLSSISHDLRTPLAAITGAVSSLLENEPTLTSGERKDLAQVAFEESERLNRLLGNLLAMTRLEAGAIHINKEWHLLEEIVGATLNRIERRLVQHRVTVHLPDDLPLIPMDSVLIEQVLLNLIENAIKYTVAGTPIEISAAFTNQAVIIHVADKGPGLRQGDEMRVFDKFYRAEPDARGGVGLGLTICQGIVQAHGGQIWAGNNSTGGAIFSFSLPVDGQPEVDAEDD